MSTRRRDALGAAVATLVVWIVGRARGHSRSEMVRPAPFLLGVAVAVAVECAFARWPARARRVWRRPAVHIGAPIALVAVALGAARRFGAAALAATLGGLAGYFGLLVGVVAGAVPEPATWFDDG